MDLRDMLNTDGGAAAAGASASRQPSQPPPSLSKPPSTSSISTAPQTPIQTAPPPHAFGNYGPGYSQSVRASPVQLAHSPHEYGPSSAHPGHPPPGPPYASSPTTSYRQTSGSFASRPAPPPIQPPGSNTDPRSPGSASMSGPSPYRHTPTSSLSAASGGYPFPPQSQNPLPPSPQQRHMYGLPNTYSRDPRESFGSPAGTASTPTGVTGMPTGTYISGQQQQQQQSMPQTPPVGTPGGNHAYLQHQRSQSIQSTSTSTPTSAHPHYGAPYGAPTGSPLATTHPLPQFDPNKDQRQSSQPPTPLGPPLSTVPRQSSVVTNNYPQPPSPYQQRISSSSSTVGPPPSPFSSQQQAHLPHHPPHQSPPPSRTSSIPRAPNSYNTPYDIVGDAHRRSQSQASQSRSEREHSLSVSPKTRVPSLPSSAGEAAPGRRLSSIGGESSDSLYSAQRQPPPASAVPVMDRTQRDSTPAKRKLEDRDLAPEELNGNNRPPPPPPQLNGSDGNVDQTPPKMQKPVVASASPDVSQKRRNHYPAPPAWARSAKGSELHTSRNYVIKSKRHDGSNSTEPVNGHGQHHPQQHPPAPIDTSMRDSPEASRVLSVGVPKAEEQAPTSEKMAAALDPNNKAWVAFDGKPLAVEPISLNKPLDYLCKSVADFVYIHVIDNNHMREIRSRGINFEVEAKLGTIIDRDTNFRVHYPVDGECILRPEARVAFRSSMTVAQHSEYNKWLNDQIVVTDPRNPQNRNQHVKIDYKHRRETDRFYELPAPLSARLPHALQELQSSKAPPKARVTTNNQTGEIIATIVKARVADMHLHFPMYNLDCRISVNLEWDWDGTPQEIMAGHPKHRERAPDRNKDRLSYTQGHFSVDLTQVTQEIRNSTEKEHELEVEADTDVLIEHGLRLQSGAESRFPELVEAFVDNIRVLARQCPHT